MLSTAVSALKKGACARQEHSRRGVGLTPLKDAVCCRDVLAFFEPA